MFKRLLWCILLLIFVKAGIAANSIKADLNSDGSVNFNDLAIFAQNWLNHDLVGAPAKKNFLINADFTGTFIGGVPQGWYKYVGGDSGSQLSFVSQDDGAIAAILEDNDDGWIEFNQILNPAMENRVYKFSLKACAVGDYETAGAKMTMKFFPSQKQLSCPIAFTLPANFQEYSICEKAPQGTTYLAIYIATGRTEQGKVLVKDVQLTLEEKEVPEKVIPHYHMTKNLFQNTVLFKAGIACIKIIAPGTGRYAEQADIVQQSIYNKTGLFVPIVSDSGLDISKASSGNFIVIGNRSTNNVISDLYDRFLLMTDVKYPGNGGYEVRSIHNPFGYGTNIILLGGSDDAGITSAANAFANIIDNTAFQGGDLVLDWLMDVHLADASVPNGIDGIETWDMTPSHYPLYGFGWNIISKNMAMYYMTGNSNYAREVVRLANPDAQAIAVLENDGEIFPDPSKPVSSVYHYGAHYMILLWDLIEESPVFSDAERLIITNDFADQLSARLAESIYQTDDTKLIYDRHWQYSALSLYCLANYFNKYYSSPLWQECINSAEYYFSYQCDPSRWGYDREDLSSFTSGVEALISYVYLSGNQNKQEYVNAIKRYLDITEISFGYKNSNISDSIVYTGIASLNKAAVSTNEGKWLWYLENTRVDSNEFRIGQSFWPSSDSNLKSEHPTYLLDKWTTDNMASLFWKKHGCVYEESESFYRSAYYHNIEDNANCDYIYISGFDEGYYGAVKSFNINELCINGVKLLDGDYNKIITRRNGIYDPRVPTDAALKYSDVVGETAFFVSEAKGTANCIWKRSLMHHPNRYTIIADELQFIQNCEDMHISSVWSAKFPEWVPSENSLNIKGENWELPNDWLRIHALDCTISYYTQNSSSVLRRHPAVDSIWLSNADAAGDYLLMEFQLKQAIKGQLFVEVYNYEGGRNPALIYLDNILCSSEFVQSLEYRGRDRISLGVWNLSAGIHRVKIKVSRYQRSNAYICLCGLLIKPTGASSLPVNPVFKLCPSDVLYVKNQGFNTYMDCNLPVEANQVKTSFYLIGQDDNGLDCIRIADHNAAIISVPEHAIVACGKYGLLDAELSELSAFGLAGHNLISAGLDASYLCLSDRPINIEWDFINGTATIVSDEDVNVSLAIIGNEILIDNMLVQGNSGQFNTTQFHFGSGRHIIGQAVVPGSVLENLSSQLGAMHSYYLSVRPDPIVAPQPSNVPVWNYTNFVSIGGTLQDMLIISKGQSELICAAETNKVHVLDSSLNEVAILQTTSNVKVMHFWNDYGLLLIGCSDQKVIAFNINNWQVQWTFISQMASEVYETGKDYWYNTYSGMEGVHGLGSGILYNNQSQAFIGSACTVEIINSNGQLMKRLATTKKECWGPVNRLLLMSDSTGKKLLCGQKPNGYDHILVVNQSMNLDGTGYYTVPDGHTFIDPWMSVYRVGLETGYNGEVVTGISGDWSRVTIYSSSGVPIYNAQLGSEDDLTSMDVGDINGDSYSEILTGQSSGSIICFDDQCAPQWLYDQITSNVKVIKISSLSDGSHVIVVGYTDGRVAQLDPNGKLLILGNLSSYPNKLEQIGNHIIVGCANGQIHLFEL